MEFIFVVSSERSGSNLLTRMLDRHPRLCGPSPSHLFRILSAALPGYGDLRQAPAWRALVDDAVALLDAMLGEWRTRADAEALSAAVPERSLAALLRHVYECEARAAGKDRVVVKEIGVTGFLPFVLEAFPQARFLHLVRDPRDMALSWKRSPTHRGGVLRAARVWQADQAAALRELAPLEAAHRARRVHYEALLADPQQQLRAVAAFLGVGYDPAMLEFHDDELTRRNARRIDNWRNLERPLMRANAGGYRAALDAEERCFIEAHCRVEMAQLGYAGECRPVPDLEALATRLAAREPHTKPAYGALPEAERRGRERWQAVVEAIRARRAAPGARP